ncbi:MAG: hypothetical protein Q6L50_10950 [Gloeomargarita sp. GMQP_bins_120]
MFPPNAPAALSNLLSLVHGLVAAYQDYQNLYEREVTRRQQIAAWEKAVLAEIATKRQLLLGYLEQVLAERRQICQVLLTQIDCAVARGDNEQLPALLQTLITLAQNAPFKDLGDLQKVQAQLANPDHVWEL